MAITAVLLSALLLHVAHGHSDICPTPPAAGVAYRYTVSIPTGCSTNCTFLAKLRTNDNNSQWLDYYMEGAATGYIALGWNDASRLPLSDIIACAYNNQTQAVQVVDTFIDANGTVIVDANTRYLCSQSVGAYANGRISCSYSRSYSTHDTVNDYRIDGLYYTVYGIGNTAPAVGVNNTLIFSSFNDLNVTNVAINPRWYPNITGPATVPPTNATIATTISSNAGFVLSHVVVLLYALCAMATWSVL